MALNQNYLTWESHLENFQARAAEDERKRNFINELRRQFVKQGYSPWMATCLAEEKYKQLHK